MAAEQKNPCTRFIRGKFINDFYARARAQGNDHR
jgi:hypothetical protein